MAYYTEYRKYYTCEYSYPAAKVICIGNICRHPEHHSGADNAGQKSDESEFHDLSLQKHLDAAFAALGTIILTVFDDAPMLHQAEADESNSTHDQQNAAGAAEHPGPGQSRCQNTGRRRT